MSKQYVILCVDDEPSILKSLERVLKLEGYKILTAMSGQDALKMLEKTHVDLIIADQRMPIMNGSEFLKIVREKYPNIIRIMLSGYSDFDSLLKAINEGEIFRFISKPWDSDELKEIIHLALEQNRIIHLVENLIKNVCDMVKMSDTIPVETSEDHRCIRLKIGKTDNILSEEILYKFISLLFNSLDNEKKENLGLSSGMITKEQGNIVITIDIEKGVTLKIELPDTNEE